MKAAKTKINGRFKDKNYKLRSYEYTNMVKKQLKIKMKGSINRNNVIFKQFEVRKRESYTRKCNTETLKIDRIENTKNKLFLENI